MKPHNRFCSRVERKKLRKKCIKCNFLFFLFFSSSSSLFARLTWSLKTWWMRQDSELIRRADGTCRGRWGLEGPMDPGGAIVGAIAPYPPNFGRIRSKICSIKCPYPHQISRPSVGHFWIAFWSHNWDKEHSWILPLELGSKPNIYIHHLHNATKMVEQ